MILFKLSFLLCSFLLIPQCNGFLEGWWKNQRSIRESNATAVLTVSDQEVEVVRYDNFSIVYTLTGDISTCTTLSVESSEKTVTSIPEPNTVCPSDKDPRELLLTYTTIKEGIATLTVISASTEINVDEAFVQASVKIEDWIDTLSVVIGWLYTIAWDASFLPQIYHNWRRHSVIGLSFDFLTLNLIGFSFYFFFNMGLYWIPEIKDEYKLRHPTSILHVRLNDVIFPLYAVICTIVQIFQCFIYERGEQRVSTTCRVISGLLVTSAVIAAILVGTIEKFWWLDFLYWLSYIKLIITCIKYLPQLYQNYKLKSTEGWSIYNVILDFSGGSLSILQMFLLAYNYDDYHSVLTDPTKLGLGLLSIFFNILFFIQHYFLYRHKTIDIKKDNEKQEKKPELTSTRF